MPSEATQDMKHIILSNCPKHTTDGHTDTIHVVGVEQSQNLNRVLYTRPIHNAATIFNWKNWIWYLDLHQQTHWETPAARNEISWGNHRWTDQSTVIFVAEKLQQEGHFSFHTCCLCLLHGQLSTGYKDNEELDLELGAEQLNFRPGAWLMSN